MTGDAPERATVGHWVECAQPVRLAQPQTVLTRVPKCVDRCSSTPEFPRENPSVSTPRLARFPHEIVRGAGIFIPRTVVMLGGNAGGRHG